jgi:DNA (cytosine-5)-methyltransferase 1
MTQSEAARAVGGTMRAWQEWEAGNRRMHPGLWELFQIKSKEF